MADFQTVDIDYTELSPTKKELFKLESGAQEVQIMYKRGSDFVDENGNIFYPKVYIGENVYELIDNNQIDPTTYEVSSSDNHSITVNIDCNPVEGACCFIISGNFI